MVWKSQVNLLLGSGQQHSATVSLSSGGRRGPKATRTFGGGASGTEFRVQGVGLKIKFSHEPLVKSQDHMSTGNLR